MLVHIPPPGIGQYDSLEGAVRKRMVAPMGTGAWSRDRGGIAQNLRTWRRCCVSNWWRSVNRRSSDRR